MKLEILATDGICNPSYPGLEYKYVSTYDFPTTKKKFSYKKIHA